MSTNVEQHEPETRELDHPYALASEQILDSLSASKLGLTQDEAAVRLQRYGANALPRKTPPGLLEVFANQFKSPLIYVLVAAAVGPPWLFTSSGGRVPGVPWKSALVGG